MKYAAALLLFFAACSAHGEELVAYSADGKVSVRLKSETCPAYVRSITELRHDAEGLFFAIASDGKTTFVGCWKDVGNLLVRIYFAAPAEYQELPKAKFKAPL